MSPLPLQLLHQEYGRHIQSTYPPSSVLPSSSDINILLIHRTHKRWLVQHKEITSLLGKLASQHSLGFHVFSDSPSPSQADTIALFSRASLVVAPHGGGLSNLLYSRPGTRVVEVLCNPEFNGCYWALQSVLGQPYVGLASTIKGTCKKLKVDLVYFEELIIAMIEGLMKEKLQ